MNIKQVRVALKELVEHGDMYCVSTYTITKQLGIFTATIAKLADEMGYYMFMYDGFMYVGSEQKRLEYYYDKMRGTNPFYQTW